MLLVGTETLIILSAGEDLGSNGLRHCTNQIPDSEEHETGHDALHFVPAEGVVEGRERFAFFHPLLYSK